MISEQLRRARVALQEHKQSEDQDGRERERERERERASEVE